MKFDKKTLLIYAVTDRSWLNGKSLAEVAEQTCANGATLLQLREKELSFAEFVKEAAEIKKVADRHNVPLIINDEVGVALAVNAAGVHVGQEDMEAGRVRSLIGNDKILGVSAQTVAQAQRAEAAGADYLGVGAVFTTATKLDADYVPYETLKEICESVSIPVVAIGGIGENNVLELSGSGIAGISVVSAIFAAEDVAEATKKLKTLAEKVIE